MIKISTQNFWIPSYGSSSHLLLFPVPHLNFHISFTTKTKNKRPPQAIIVLVIEASDSLIDKDKKRKIRQRASSVKTFTSTTPKGNEIDSIIYDDKLAQKNKKKAA